MAEFLCSDCGREFDNLQNLRIFKDPYYDTTSGCPFCKSTNVYDKVNECVICGKTIYQEEKYYYCHETQECFCDDCIEERKE